MMGPNNRDLTESTVCLSSLTSEVIKGCEDYFTSCPTQYTPKSPERFDL